MALVEIILFPVPESAPVFRAEDSGRGLRHVLDKAPRKALTILWRDSWLEAKRFGDPMGEAVAVYQLSRLHGPERVERIIDRCQRDILNVPV